MSAISISPYSKKAIKPTDLIQFDWDEVLKPKTREEWIKENFEVYRLAQKIAEA